LNNFVGQPESPKLFSDLISTPRQVGIWGSLKLIKKEAIYIFEKIRL